MKKIPQDIIGNIAILKFPRKTLWIIKKLKARKFLKLHPHVTTVLEKTEKFSGQLRIPTTKYLAGIKTFQATYKENNCTFKFDVNKTYFSPRLSNERKVIADQVAKIAKPNSKILVMFAGIAPYPITIAKRLLSTSDPGLSTSSFHIYSNELNKEANASASQNIILNKLQNRITLIPGNANNLSKLLEKLNKSRSTERNKNLRPATCNLRPDNIKKFDIILMPRPNLEDTFLKTALKLSKKGTTIFYHGFGTKDSVLSEIKKNTQNKIGKIKIRKAGDIGPYKFRWQAQFKLK